MNHPLVTILSTQNPAVQIAGMICMTAIVIVFILAIFTTLFDRNE